MSKEKKSLQLGMPFGTANSQLRKRVLFSLLQKYGEDKCYRCSLPIETVDSLTLEHKLPWQDVSVELFWDLNNISFSHHRCNSGAARSRWKEPLRHGKRSMYSDKGCRCDECKKANRDNSREYRKK